jgi:hypothetical protein
VEDALDVLVLLQLVDQLKRFRRLRLGQNRGGLAHVLNLGRDGLDAPILQRLLQVAELFERQRTTICGSPSSPVLSPISSRP